MSQTDIPNPENLPEPIAPMPENLNGESADPQSRDPKTVESSSAVSPEDREWETVHLPNSINVDELEVASDLATPAEAEETYPLPLDDEVATCAQPMAAQESEAPDESESAEVELCQRIEHLETVLARYQRSLDEQLLSASTQQAQIDEKIRQLEVAREQINYLSQELEGCRSEIRSSQMAIATLSENWQQSQARLAQLERECATTQQRYNQQVQLNLQAANTCRELRSRLHRQQRQALQFKAALEKSLARKEFLINRQLEESPTEQDTQLNLPGNFSSDPSLDAPEDPWAVSPSRVVPNSVPIEPWSTTSETPRSEFEETPEDYAISVRRHEKAQAPETSNPESLSETFWPEENNLIQTIREIVSTDSKVKATPSSSSRGDRGGTPTLPVESASEEPLSNTEAPSSSSSSRVDRGGTPTLPVESDTDSGSDLRLNSDLREIPEIADPINTQEAEDGKIWPAPVVYPQRSIKKRRSLAAVELPSFPTKQ